MSTVRATVTVDAELLEKAQCEVPGESTSAAGTFGATSGLATG